MFLSAFDIFKVGVGPSSSHTMGPMVAAGRFLAALRSGADRIPGAGEPARLGCRLHGSLAFTGKGHATDRAVILGLAGFDPGDFDAARAAAVLAAIAETGRVAPPDLPELAFDAGRDLVFDFGPALPGHANGLVLSAWDGDGNLHLQETYYSVGGGFVVTARELERPPRDGDGPPVPHPFRSADELVARAEATGLGIAALQRANELTRRSASELDAGTGAALGGDDRIDRPRARGSGRAARRAQGAPPGRGDPSAPAGRARPEPDGAAYHQRLDRGLCHRGERGERRRRAGGDRADQRRRGRGAGDDPLFPRPRSRRRRRRGSPSSC